MGKPRIIIADTDVRYIIPLQLQFVQEYFEKIDLEIISDKDYFSRTFSVPQKADILIISEELFDSSLQKHNIGIVFLMMEKNEEEQTADLNINRIFKYTSIKEIFNEITGKSASILKEKTGKKTETQIIMVYSAAGGVGKTTIALGMAACLTQSFKKVLYINASWLQTFQRMLDNKSAITTSEVYAQLTSNDTSLYDSIRHELRKELFTYLPPFKASLMSLGMDYTVYERLACSAKKSRDFDYIIVDSDTEYDEEKAALISVADKVIIVTKQDSASVFSTNLLVSSINGVNSDKYIFICNDFKKEMSNALIAPDANLRFSISEYVEHINNYDLLKVSSFGKINSLQKISFLVL